MKKGSRKTSKWGFCRHRLDFPAERKGDWKETRSQRRQRLVLWLKGVRFMSIERAIEVLSDERESAL